MNAVADAKKYNVWLKYAATGEYHCLDVDLTVKEMFLYGLDNLFDDAERALLNLGELVFDQSTGHKDKDGREIYEGDIIKITHQMTKTRSVSHTYVVKYFDDRAAFGLSLNGDGDFACAFYPYAERAEVIGSIRISDDLKLLTEGEE